MNNIVDHLLPTLRSIYRFNLTSCFPIDAEVSLADIAATVGLPEGEIKRIIRTAITHRIFAEPTEE